MEENNMAAMRETLEFADRELRMATEDDRYGDDIVYLVGCMRTVAAACRAALAAPPRNCDVGTAEEQIERFDAFCDAHKYVGDDGANWCSTTCPCYNVIDCGVKWAQMPYEADESEVEK